MKETGKWKKVLGNLDVTAAVVVLIGLIILTFVGVFRRYLFRSPIAWMEEVQMILFLWVVFLAAGAAFRAGGHVAIEIVVDSLPKKIRGFIEGLDVLLQLVILGYLTYQSFIFYMQFIESGKATIFLHLPYSVAYVVLPIGCVLMIVSVLVTAYQTYFKKGGEENHE